ncbi:MAG: hypothetical protein ACTSVF_03250 [Candidatus Asgardarchaeia archaeon]
MKEKINLEDASNILILNKLKREVRDLPLRLFYCKPVFVSKEREEKTLLLTVRIYYDGNISEALEFLLSKVGITGGLVI